MDVATLRSYFGKNVIIGDRWGFGWKFYQCRLNGLSLEAFENKERLGLFLSYYEKYNPFIHRTFQLSDSHRVYLPS